MSTPASNDQIDPDAIEGGSEKGARLASTVFRWTAIAALAVARALVYAISANAEELTEMLIRVADGDTLTLRTAQLDYRIRISGIDAPEKGHAFGNRSKQNLVLLALNKDARLDCYKTDQCPVQKVTR